MFLSERKLKILHAIINDYIETAEPIGSRTIAKKYDFGLSSATIRNEMSDLEDMGLIIQPHASAGRVPSDKGYRLYVDNLMNQKELKKEEVSFLHEIVKNNIDNIEYLMQETAKAISYITSYTALVSEPHVRKLVVKHVHLVPYDDNDVILVLVTDSKVVKNYTLRLPEASDYDMLNNMNIILNHIFSGKTIDDIDFSKVKENLKKAGKEGKILLEVIDGIVKTITEETDFDIFKSGVRNILGFPEFSDVSKASAVFQALEERDVLITLLGSGDSEDLNIVIGKENTIDEIKNCSIIKTGYRFKDKAYGTIGILGPTRMDYAQVVSILKVIEKNINRALMTFEDG